MQILPKPRSASQRVDFPPPNCPIGDKHMPLYDRTFCNAGWREMLDREFDPAPQPLPDGRTPPTGFQQHII